MSTKLTFKKGDTVTHPQHGDREVTAVITTSTEPAVTLQGVIGAVPTRILKPKVTVQKPDAK